MIFNIHVWEYAIVPITIVHIDLKPIEKIKWPQVYTVMQSETTVNNFYLQSKNFNKIS